MVKLRAQREAEDGGGASPIDLAARAWHDFQNGPRIPRPSTAETFIPVIGPAWEAAGDLQDGNYGGAAFNVVMAAVDALPFGTAVKGARSAMKGIGILKKGSVTANAAAKALRRAGVAGEGEEIHHSIPLDGLGRTVQSAKSLRVPEGAAEGTAPAVDGKLGGKAKVRSDPPGLVRDDRLDENRSHRSRELGRRRGAKFPG